MDNVTIYDRPTLRSPHLVLAWSGWPNAGEVATGAVTYLRDKMGAKRLAAIDPEEFYDFTTQRPMIIIENGEIKRIRPPANTLYYYQNPYAEHDLVLMRGAEPHLKWRTYINTILSLLEEHSIYRVYALGGLYDRVYHKREPVVSGLPNVPEVRDLLAAHGIVLSSYQGPGALHTSLLAAFAERGIPGMSMWGHAPIYVQNVANPKVCHALLRRVADMAGLKVDLSDVKAAGDYLDDTLDSALAQSADLRNYVSQMQQEGADQPSQEPVSLDDAQRIIKEVEDFLRGNLGQEGGPTQ